MNASGPVEEHLHLGVLHRGHARDRVREELLHAIPLLGQELRLEALRDAVERPRRRLALVAAHHEAADLGAEVDEVVGVAQRRQRLERRLERLGDQVLVAVRDDRQVDADHARELGRVHAGGIDDDLALDAALIRLDGGDAAVRRLDAGDADARLDLRADAARGVGERERELARVEVAVVGDERGGEHAVGAHRREELLRLLRADDLHRQAERLRPRRLAADLLEPRLRRREPQPAELVPARVVAGQLLQLGVEPDGVLHHPRQRDRRAQLADEAGAVPGRAVRELVLLDEQRVRPPELREVVEDRAAHDAAPDHDRPRALRNHGRE